MSKRVPLPPSSPEKTSTTLDHACPTCGATSPPVHPNDGGPTFCSDAFHYSPFAAQVSALAAEVERLRKERDDLATETARIATLAEQAAAALGSLHSDTAAQVRRAYESVAAGLRRALAAVDTYETAQEGSDVQDR